MTQLAQSLALSPEPARLRSGVPADEVIRVRLGASIDSAPDLLAALAVDPAVTVRAAVALNTATPAGADRILAHDGDERVRTCWHASWPTWCQPCRMPSATGCNSTHCRC